MDWIEFARAYVILLASGMALGSLTFYWSKLLD